jgi:hypothetical protein
MCDFGGKGRKLSTHKKNVWGRIIIFASIFDRKPKVLARKRAKSLAFLPRKVEMTNILTTLVYKRKKICLRKQGNSYGLY